MQILGSSTSLKRLTVEDRFCKQNAHPHEINHNSPLNPLLILTKPNPAPFRLGSWYLARLRKRCKCQRRAGPQGLSATCRHCRARLARVRLPSAAALVARRFASMGVKKVMTEGWRPSLVGTSL